MYERGSQYKSGFLLQARAPAKALGVSGLARKLSAVLAGRAMPATPP
jgi:hypothetical protein